MRRALLTAVAAVVVLVGTTGAASGCTNPPTEHPGRFDPHNITRLQTLDPGTVTDHYHYGAKAYWMQIERDGRKTWGKVSRRSYIRCQPGGSWPSCREKK